MINVSLYLAAGISKVKKLVCLIFLISFSVNSYGQFNETFEDETTNATTFSGGGVVYQTTGSIKVGNFTNGGCGGFMDHKYIDGITNATADASAGEIQMQTANTNFKINSLCIWLSTDGGITALSGTFKLRGTLNGGGTVTTGPITVTEPCMSDCWAPNISMAGTALENVYLTKVEVLLPLGFNYIAIDNFNFNSQSQSVVLTCPTNTIIASCQTQGAVDAAFTAWMGTASGSGGCSGVLSNNSTGAPPACGGSTTVTFTYTSTCVPFITTCQATFTVSPPSNPTPVFANCGSTASLGCNPFNLPSCTAIASGGFGGAVTASNSCGSVPVSCSAGSVTVNGCNRSQEFTFTATACGQTSTCTRTYNWTVVTPPSFNGTCGNSVINLGCNPVTLPACDPNVMASNECGPITVICQVGAIQTNGCNRSQTLTYVANAIGCGNFSTCTRIHNWQVTTAPVFANCDNTFDLGCNPGAVPTCADVQTAPFGGAVTACNECGNVTGITCSEGITVSNGCNRTKVFTFSVTACGFTSTCTRTFTWKVATAPVFDNCTTGTTNLGCNPASLPSCDLNVTATSECGPAIVICTAGAITSNGCNREQIFTYVATGECGTSTCTRTFVWTVPLGASLVCPGNTTTPACQTQTAVDQAFANWLAVAQIVAGGCNGVLTNNNTGAPSACGGSTSVTFTYTNGCGPGNICTVSFTVAAPSTPNLSVIVGTTQLNSCQSQSALNSAYNNWLNNNVVASGGCNGVLTNNSTGPPSVCGGSTTVTWTYTTSCAQPITAQATFQVLPSPPIMLSCAMNQTLPAGQSQAQVNSAFTTWLGTTMASGGCNGMLSNNNMGAPPATGGNTTVTFTYTSSCAPLNTTCQATFNVEAGQFQNMQTGLSYPTLQGAIDAAMPGQTIILLDNLSESNVVVNNSVIIEANGFSLTIPSGSLTIPSGKSLTWKEDTLFINAGASIDNDGTLINNGTINYQGGTGTFNNTGTFSGSGNFQGNLVNMSIVNPGK